MGTVALTGEARCCEKIRFEPRCYPYQTIKKPPPIKAGAKSYGYEAGTNPVNRGARSPHELCKTLLRHL